MNNVRNKRPAIPVFTIALLVMLTVSVVFQLIYVNIYGKKDVWLIASDLLFTVLLELVITLFVFWSVKLFNRIFGHWKNRWYRYVAEVIFIIAGAIAIIQLNLLLLIGENQFRDLNDHTTILTRQYHGINLTGAVFCYLVVTGLFLYEETLLKSHRTVLLQKQYSEVRLQALQHQLSPHFLFNSLSVLSTLVHESAADAEKFISQLSVIYRYILDQQTTALVPLQKELTFLSAYYFLLAIRFENKIELSTSVSSNAENFLIAPLTLQLLVENAVKHNKMTANDPLRIHIFNQSNTLIIKNSLNRRESNEKSLGIGLQNITSRYELLAGKKIQYHSTPDSFIVQIPLIKSLTA